MRPTLDTLSRFVIEDRGVRGEHVHLDSTWQTLLERAAYGRSTTELLGETLAAVALLAATIKFDGALTLQATGDGALRLLVVEASGERTLRGLARLRAAGSAEADVDGLLGRGRIALTIDPGGGQDRYQGIVEFDGGPLAQVLERYFERSEQIPTRIWLAADGRRAAGLLLQHLPDHSPVVDSTLGGRADDGEGWHHCMTLAETLTSGELLDLDAPTVLRRLFHRERVRLFEPERWGFRCRCSLERVRTMLRGLGKAEVDDVLAEQGEVSVNCEFCNARYRFDAIDAGLIFVDDGAVAPAREM